MTTYQAYSKRDVAQEPVSPLSPRSEAIWRQQQHHAEPVSPENGPGKIYPPGHIFTVPKHKPVAASTSRPGQCNSSRSEIHPSRRPTQNYQTRAPSRMQVTQKRNDELLAMPRMSEQYLQTYAPPKSKPSRSHSQRPRSQSFHLPSRSSNSSEVMEMPTTIFLQDYQTPAGVKPQRTHFLDEKPTRPIQSSVSSNSSDSLEFIGRMRCYKCNIPETPMRKPFTKCGRCNIHWCTLKCYAGHKCAKTVYDRIPNQPPRAKLPRSSPPEQRAQSQASSSTAPQGLRPAGRQAAMKQARVALAQDMESQKPGEKSARKNTWTHLAIWGIPLVVIFLIILLLAIKFS